MAGGIKPRTSVYIDAFNLYFGALKGTPYRWLDVLAMSRAYLRGNDITSIKYFTAKVSARPNDPQQPARQQAYLRALETIPCVQIIYGHYLSHTVRARLANPAPGGPTTVEIVKTEEKGSDVNLATHLIHDAHLDRFDVAVVVSNDSDLLSPIQLVRADLRKKVGILNPQKNMSRVLHSNADFYKPIRAAALDASQFPAELVDANGRPIHKPPTW